MRVENIAAQKRRRTIGVLSIIAAGVTLVLSVERTQVASAGVQVTAPGGVSSGLVLWLDASNPLGTGTLPLANTEVTEWADLSPADNDGSINPNGIGDPNTGAIFESSPTGFNGQPALRFNRIDDNSGSVYQTADLDIRATARPDVTVFALYKPTSLSRNNGVWGNDNLEWDRFFLSYIPFFGDGVNDGLVSLGPTLQGEVIEDTGTTTEPKLMTMGYSGNIVNGVNQGDPNASFAYFNCALERTFTDSTDATDARATLSVGWDGDNSVFDGYIAEVIVYERILNLTELEDVNLYLAEKYGLETGCADVTCDVSGARTLSQGGWSNLSSSSPLNDVWFDTNFDPSLSIGGNSGSVTLETATNVRRFLPQSGTPAVLNSTFFNPTSKQLKNVLAGQATALTLNLALNPGMAGATLTTGYGETVSELLEDVNDALNGTGSPSKSLLSQLSKLAEYVNLSFPGGVDQGFVACPSDN